MKWKLVIVVFFAALGLRAQELSSWLNPNKILIGETVNYTLKVKLAPGTAIRYEAYQGSIPAKAQLKNGSLSTGQVVDVEIVEPFHDTLIKGKLIDTWIGTYSVTIWDSGVVVLPEQYIVIGDSTYFFDPVKLSANFVAGQQDQDIYDIKESFADIPEPQTWIQKTGKFLWTNSYWILPILAILVFVWIQFRRHKNANKRRPKQKETSLKDRTLTAIEALEKRRLWQDGLLKEHYTELSYIMRAYLSTRYQLNLLEKTTLETRLLLQQTALHAETIDTLMIILFQADMVKFAQSEPDEINILKVSVLAKQIVAETSPIEFENVE